MGFLDHNGMGIAYGLDAFMRAYNAGQDRQLRREGMEWQKNRQASLDDLTRQQFKMQQDQYNSQRNQANANAQLAANPGLLSSVGQTGPFQPGQGLNNMPSADMIWKVQQANAPKSPKMEYHDGQFYQMTDKGPVATGPRYVKPDKPDAPTTTLGKLYALHDRLPETDPRRGEVQQAIEKEVTANQNNGGNYTYKDLMGDIEATKAKIASLMAGVGISDNVTSPQRQVAINQLQADLAKKVQIARGLAQRSGQPFPYDESAPTHSNAADPLNLGF